MTAAQTPREIYEFALEERKSDEPLRRRDACEKGWLAAVEAVDGFLATKGIFIPAGSPEAHKERNKALNDLALQGGDSMWKLRDKFFAVQSELHGACFYGNEDSPAYDRDLKVTVSEILELTEND